jgi:hypothetical protein
MTARRILIPGEFPEVIGSLSRLLRRRIDDLPFRFLQIGFVFQ